MRKNNTPSSQDTGNLKETEAFTELGTQFPKGKCTTVQLCGEERRQGNNRTVTDVMTPGRRLNKDEHLDRIMKRRNCKSAR